MLKEEDTTCPCCNTNRTNLSTLGQWETGKEFRCDLCGIEFEVEFQEQSNE